MQRESLLLRLCRSVFVQKEGSRGAAASRRGIPAAFLALTRRDVASTFSLPLGFGCRRQLLLQHRAKSVVAGGADPGQTGVLAADGLNPKNAWSDETYFTSSQANAVQVHRIRDIRVNL